MTIERQRADHLVRQVLPVRVRTRTILVL